MVYSKTRDVYVIASLGTNTLSVWDASTLVIKQIFGISYSITNGEAPSVKSIDGFHKYLNVLNIYV